MRQMVHDRLQGRKEQDRLLNPARISVLKFIILLQWFCSGGTFDRIALPLVDNVSGTKAASTPSKYVQLYIFYDTWKLKMFIEQREKETFKDLTCE